MSVARKKILNQIKKKKHVKITKLKLSFFFFTKNIENMKHIYNPICIQRPNKNTLILESCWKSYIEISPNLEWGIALDYRFSVCNFTRIFLGRQPLITFIHLKTGTINEFLLADLTGKQLTLKNFPYCISHFGCCNENKEKTSYVSVGLLTKSVANFILHDHIVEPLFILPFSQIYIEEKNFSSIAPGIQIIGGDEDHDPLIKISKDQKTFHKIVNLHQSKIISATLLKENAFYSRDQNNVTILTYL